MNLENFDDEPKLRKTIRVLVYPNITFQEDLEKDSYIQVIKNQIKLLNSIRNDLWFYLILPTYVPSIGFENTTQLMVPMPTYPPTMRSHFDVGLIKSHIGHNIDIDLIMSHLPEHTHQLINTTYNLTHHTPPIFGYCHWFDLKEVVAWPKDSFNQNMLGLLEYDRCYLNTQFQKEMVLKQASTILNSETIQKLNKILVPQHLGVNKSDVVGSINESPNKTIVFNHRPDTYKHFKEFMEVMDELRKQREDFNVWIPLLDKPNRPWVSNKKFNKSGYYKELQNCYVGFSPKQKYGGWSVSTTDGMMNGVPYVMYDAGYYQELYEKGDFFKDNHSALMLLNRYLDDLQYRNKQAVESLNWINNKLVYKDKMIEMSKYMDSLLDSQRSISATDKFSEIVNYIKERKVVRKNELIEWLGWGRGIKWTPYRRALMNHSNIYDMYDPGPHYCWKE